MRAAPYTSVGKSVIYVPGFYEGRKSSTHKSQVARAQPELVVAAPASGPSEVIQSDMETKTSEDRGEGIKVSDLELLKSINWRIHYHKILIPFQIGTLSPTDPLLIYLQLIRWYIQRLRHHSLLRLHRQNYLKFK